MTHEPSTPAEWQEAVDLAKGMLEIDACRQYGLIKGGPTPNVERCEQILLEGKKRGYTPAPDAGVRVAEAWNNRDSK